jgi:hypothetical protein
MSRWAGQKLTCGKCLTQWFVYYDIHDKASMCPCCNQVQGIIWDEDGSQPQFRADHLYDRGDCEPHLDGEGEYEWDWLEYKKEGGDAIGA